uniref:Uncharacterized protein n=1 Tax=Cannabis sativa TaxID=3483 RepID=A0A803PWR8_CANSA
MENLDFDRVLARSVSFGPVRLLSKSNGLVPLDLFVPPVDRPVSPVVYLELCLVQSSLVILDKVALIVRLEFPFGGAKFDSRFSLLLFRSSCKSSPGLKPILRNTESVMGLPTTFCLYVLSCLGGFPPLWPLLRLFWSSL